MLNTKRLVFLRKRKVLKQSDIADMLEINVATYGLLERSGDFKASQIVKLAKFFNVKIAYLFGEDGYDSEIIGDNNNVLNANGKHINLTNNGNNSVAVLQEKIKGLEKEVKNKDEIIKLLKEKL